MVNITASCLYGDKYRRNNVYNSTRDITLLRIMANINLAPFRTPFAGFEAISALRNQRRDIGVLYSLLIVGQRNWIISFRVKLWPLPTASVGFH